MKRKPDPDSINDDGEKKRLRAALPDDGKLEMTAAKYFLLPHGISRIVGDYSEKSIRRYAEATLVGLRPIILCFSQDIDSQVGDCWSMGLLSPECQWESLNINVDMEFTFDDHENYLRSLYQENSDDFPLVIDVLIVKLSKTTSDSTSALDGLQSTMNALEGHFNSVNHVIISIDECASCCFTLKDVTIAATGVHQSIDRWKAILEILNDLKTCWTAYSSLAPADLFAFYFNSETSRPSGTYLTKIVISVAHPLGLILFKQQASITTSNKIMWVYRLKSLDDAKHIDEDTVRLCHAVLFDGYNLMSDEGQQYDDYLERLFCFKDNCVIERIVINTNECGGDMLLPRPSDPLTDPIRLSALVELTLKGDTNALHLTQLNNDYFPQLAHLTIIGGEITGHLDSRRVPSLKTLRINLGFKANQYRSSGDDLMEEHTQSLIDTGRPWQLVASQEPGGWSLASFDDPIPNPQEDSKEDAAHPHALPVIRELLLVASLQEHIDEWQLQLKGSSSVKSAAHDPNDHLLLWAPECIENITAFSTSEECFRLEFKEVFPGQSRALISLTCHKVSAALDGVVLPNLQFLMVNSAPVELTGVFPCLQELSIEDSFMEKPWHLNAPLLRYFSCCGLRFANDLSLDLQSLPHLSFLEIVPFAVLSNTFPNMTNIDSHLGLSGINHVVLESGMTLSPFFDQFRVSNVSQLALAVNAFKLPACWFNTEWLCESLVVDVHASPLEGVHADEELIMVTLPPLSRVRNLSVKESNCRVLLNSEMPNLIECTVTSPKSFGEKLYCPALQRIRFTDELSESEKEKCLDPATYVAIGARPKMISFDYDGEVRLMKWNVVLNDDEDPSLV